MSKLFRYCLSLAFLLPAPQLYAQNAWAVTDFYYDEETGEAFGYAYLTVDYTVQNYYKLRIEARLKNSSNQTLDLDIEWDEDVYELQASVSSTNTSPGSSYSVAAKFRVDARYQDYYGYYWDWWFYTYWPPYNIDAQDYYDFYGPGPETTVSDRFIWIGQVHSNGSSECGCTCSTPVTYSEWSNLKSSFPNLMRCHTCKLGPATSTYNCMAWTLDDTSKWWWFEADANSDGLLSTAELNSFYATKGKSDIAYYGSSTSNVKHVAKKGGGNGSNCQASSKLGSDIRMAHKLSELEGGSEYGNIVGGN
jgi:hypothetical protein